MSNKSLLKFGAAFVLLAALLIFLGVNFVPRIFASSSTEGNIVVAGKQTRPDYLDERYPRAMLDSRFYPVLTSEVYLLRQASRGLDLTTLSANDISVLPSSVYLLRQASRGLP